MNGFFTIDYPEATCPICEGQEGTEPGVCHLLPSKSDPVSVFVAFLACENCDRMVREGSEKHRENVSKRTVTFFDNWLELEFAPQFKRGAA